MEYLQIQLKVPFLISSNGKIGKFPKFLVVAFEHMVLKQFITSGNFLGKVTNMQNFLHYT